VPAQTLVEELLRDFVRTSGRVQILIYEFGVELCHLRSSGAQPEPVAQSRDLNLRTPAVIKRRSDRRSPRFGLPAANSNQTEVVGELETRGLGGDHARAPARKRLNRGISEVFVVTREHKDVRS
jgi:hypothetical protein